MQYDPNEGTVEDCVSCGWDHKDITFTVGQYDTRFQCPATKATVVNNYMLGIKTIPTRELPTNGIERR